MVQASGLLFVFSGPSGAGKNAIMQAVMARLPGLEQLPTATTRPMRDNEKQGREHEFITEDEFHQRIRDKQLIEWQIIHDKGIYGVPRATIQEGIRVGKTMVADVDVLGAMQLKQEFGDHLVLIFVDVPDMATLENRLRKRSDFDGEEHLASRLRRADFEMEFKDEYDYVVVNRDNKLDEAVDRVIEIIKAELGSVDSNVSALGFNPDDIYQTVTGVVVQNGKVLVKGGEFPEISVPDNPVNLPYDAIRDKLQALLGVPIVPGRADAVHRKVDDSFEPPQVIRTVSSDDGIEKGFIYVVYTEQPLTHLPEGWEWANIDSLNISSSLRNAIGEASFLLHTD
jgi:guanylate kinase